MRPRAATRTVLALAGTAVLAAGCSSGPSATERGTTAPASTERAVGIWAAPPVEGASKRGDAGCPAGAGAFTHGTVRDVVHPARSGSRIRVRLSNLYGTGPLVVDAATLANETSGPALDPATVRTLSFDGKKDVTVQAGDEAISDWTSLTVSPQHDLAVSFHVSSTHGPATFHPIAKQTSYYSADDTDQSARTSALTGQQLQHCWLWVDGVDEQAPSTVAGSVVAFGDSITDGQHSTIDGNARWPDDLARRLATVDGTTMSVVDEGIGGNRVLSAGATAGAHGVSGLSRFGRDALGQPGVRTVILLEGINDIGGSDAGRTAPLSGETLIHGYQKLIAQAHARHVRVVGATLTPFKGAGYWTSAGEQLREQVNRWILTSHAFDATVDFAKAVADPHDPQTYLAAYDSGDHLHPNDAGYAAMARAVDLTALTAH